MKILLILMLIAPPSFNDDRSISFNLNREEFLEVIREMNREAERIRAEQDKKTVKELAIMNNRDLSLWLARQDRAFLIEMRKQEVEKCL